MEQLIAEGFGTVENIVLYYKMLDIVHTLVKGLCVALCVGALGFGIGWFLKEA